MSSLAISRMVSVARPRKSNLTRPIASTSSLSYWLTAESLPGCWYSGQKSVSLPGAISTPPACMPTLRVMPSSFCASASSVRTSSSLLQPLGQDGFGLDRAIDRDMGSGLVRYQLADAIAKGVAHVQHPAHVADRGARGHGAEGGDLAHGILAVLVLDVVDDAVAVGLAEVDVEVGHRDPLRVQETLEQQVVAQRIEVGDALRIGHQRARAGTPARSDRAAVVLGPVDEVAHDQEVARENPSSRWCSSRTPAARHNARCCCSRSAASGYRCASRTCRP